MESISKLEYTERESEKKSIIACLHDKPVSIESLLNEGDSHGVDFVNINISPEEKTDDFVTKFDLDDKGETLCSYIISPIDSRDKFSLKYVECTGVIICGVDKETGENISLLSHQNPNFFLFDKDLSFFKDIKEKAKDLLEKCEPDSLDVVLFGGKFSDSDNATDIEEAKDNVDKLLYIKSIKYISKVLFDILHIEPTVISGPKFSLGFDHAIFINNTRRLHIFRNVIDSKPDFIESFDSGNVIELAQKWK